MRVGEVTLHVVRLPLRLEVRHASATRRDSENLLVRCRLLDGTEGWGEGVPRDYVTGETAEGAIAQLAATALAEQLDLDCCTWKNVIELCDRFRPALQHEDPRGCYGNALRCAVELSLLDAFGKLFAEPVSRVTYHFEPARSIRASRTEVRYSAAVTSATFGMELLQTLMARLYGFVQCKVKVGVKGFDDVARLRRIRSWIGRRVDLRIDANGSWRGDEIAEKIEQMLPFGISAVEQPTSHEEVETLSGIRGKLPVPVMLDESLTCLNDAQRAIRLGVCDLFNIRLSKCGGFLNCLRMAGMAHEAGLGYQLGCHPGESGLLSAAGRHWAVSVDSIRYLEGSYDRYLLGARLTNEDVTFRYGGRAPALAGPGLGVTINPQVLARLTTRKKTYHLDH